MSEGIVIDLGTFEGFTIAAAIRGPDSQTGAALKLKNTLTGRFRYLATGASERTTNLSGFLINPHLVSEVNLDDLIATAHQAKIGGLDISHFLGHIEEGTKLLAANFEKSNHPQHALEARRLCSLAQMVLHRVAAI